MELVIQFLMAFIVINCVLKLSFWKPWQTLVFALLCALFILFAWKYAVSQSKTQIENYLNDVSILQNIAVLITLESAVCFAFCFAALRAVFGKRTKRFLLPLQMYPSLLLFPVLFNILTQTIFALSGTDFSIIAYVLATLVFFLLPLLSWLIRLFLPETELRLEVHFLISLLVCILGLLVTVNGNVTYAAAKEPMNVEVLLLSLGGFSVTFLLGVVSDKVKWWILQRKENRKAKINGRLSSGTP